MCGGRGCDNPTFREAIGNSLACRPFVGKGESSDSYEMVKKCLLESRIMLLRYNDARL